MGLFFRQRSQELKAHLFVDYQNVHWSAFESFAPYGAQIYDSLIHPGKFADRITEARKAKHFPDAEIEKIHVFRGWPSRRHEGDMHARVQRQRSNWTRDRRVDVNLRTLRYPRDWPDTPSQEKGVDVAFAIAMVKCALAQEADVIIAATRDTDAIPALELISAQTDVRVELANWKGQSELKLTPQPPAVYLDKSEYNRSRDTFNYA